MLRPNPLTPSKPSVLLREPAPAKINLTLHVTGRRPDGYHRLDSLVVFAGARDIITAESAPVLSLRITGRFAPGLDAGPDNLVLRAARALSEATGTTKGAHLTLEKNLPVASGIGGGSSDAAATLRGLARLWQVHLPAPALAALAAKLGADVPVCLAATPARMQGIGEILAPAPAIPACGILLANPGVALATQDVFRARTGAFSPPSAWPAAWTTPQAMAADLAQATNDLQAPAEALCPPITAVLRRLQTLPHALLARMSGSGATCFALFHTPARAAQAAASLQHTPGWYWGGPLYEPAAAP